MKLLGYHGDTFQLTIPMNVPRQRSFRDEECVKQSTEIFTHAPAFYSKHFLEKKFKSLPFKEYVKTVLLLNEIKVEKQTNHQYWVLMKV